MGPESTLPPPQGMEEAPPEVKLRVLPGQVNQFHQQVLSRLNARLEMSHSMMSQRRSEWDEADEVLTLYHPDAGRLDQNMQAINPIVVPASYAIHQARMTQLVGSLLVRSPILQFRAVGPEDSESAGIMEAALHHDAVMCRLFLQLYTMIADADKYGVGWIFNWWEEEHGWIMDPPGPFDIFLQRLRAMVAAGHGAPRAPRSRRWGKVREYCAARSIDPRRMYPDTRVPLSDPDSGEFIGRRDLVTIYWILERSIENGGPFFNTDTLRSRAREGPLTGSRTAHEEVRSLSLRGNVPQDERSLVPIESIRIRIIPREWGLSGSWRPEIWEFVVAGESIIIMAAPLESPYNSFGYSVAEVNHDPHALFNLGSVEMLAPLQRAMTWLLTAHYDNVRRTLNDMLVYLPSVIYEEDLLNPGPMRHIRVTQFGENAILSGQISLREAFQQLQLADITSPHLAVLEQIFTMAQRMAATSDPQMSVPIPKARTLGEVEAILGGSSKRMTMTAKVIDEMAIRPLAMRWAADRQAFTSMEFVAAAVGQTAEKLAAASALIGPGRLSGSFDYEPVAATDPPNPERTIEAWSLFMQAAGTLVQFPGFGTPDENGMIFDLKAAFREFARATGVRNVERFFRVAPTVGAAPPAVVPDEMVRRAVASGSVEAI